MSWLDILGSIGTGAAGGLQELTAIRALTPNKYGLTRTQLEAAHNGLLAQLEALSRHERQGGLANMMSRAPLVVLTREERWEAGEKPVMPWEIE